MPLGVTMRVEFDKIVDMRFGGRVVTAGAGDDPAAERRELEALRVVPERQSMRPKLVLERRPVNARTDPRRAACTIDLMHFVEAFEIERNRRRVFIADSRFDTPDNARSTAERNDSDVVASSPIEDGRDLVFSFGKSDEIGRVRYVAHPHAQDVRERSAVGVQQPIVRRCGEAGRQRRQRSDTGLA